MVIMLFRSSYGLGLRLYVNFWQSLLMDSKNESYAFVTNLDVLHGLTSLIFVFLSLPSGITNIIKYLKYSIIKQILWFKCVADMVLDHHWLTNFKLGISVVTWEILMFTSLVHFSKVVGMVLVQFVQFFPNFLAFICIIKPVTSVKMRQMSSCWISSRHKE